MHTPNKLVKFVKDSFSGLFANSSSDTASQLADSSTIWSGNSETVCVKRSEYESLQNEVLSQTETIKRLKRKDEENQSLIHDYENTFSMVLQKDLERTKSRLLLGESGSLARMEQEIEKLRSSEQRLKSHIQALKRDLVLAEEKNEAEQELHEKQAQSLTAELERERDMNKAARMRIDELSFSNKEYRMNLEKKCEELAEVVALCRLLLR